ncbi:MAG TPA: glycosyltransferase [Candidatus Brocadiaceae bacterium]
MSGENKINKIIFFIAHLSDGGAEKVLSELSCNFPNDIEQVIVLYEKKITYPYKGKLVSLDLPITSLSFPDRIYKFIQRIFRFRKIVKMEKPDCVISFMEEANFINIMVSRNPIVTVHILQSINPKRLSSFIVIKLMISALYNRAKVIAVSKGVRNDLIKKFGVKEEKVQVIYNPIGIEEIQKLSQENIYDNKLENDIPVIVTSGRLTEQKGQWHLIRAFSEVRKRIPCRLVIMGTGELDGYLRELTRELNLEDDVVFWGWQKNPYKYLANANVFVLSSLWEGFGIVLVEAMVCKLPVISTDCQSGPREILAPQSNGNNQINDIEYAEFGLLVPVCDGIFYKANDPLTKEESVLADAIVKVISDNKLSKHYSEMGLQRARDFNVNKIVEEYTLLLQEVGGSK